MNELKGMHYVGPKGKRIFPKMLNEYGSSFFDPNIPLQGKK